MRRIIWSCWLQGRQDAPEVVKRCLSSWECRNPDWDFRCLDSKTIRHYIKIEDFIDLSVQRITAASLSDIIRVLLLHEYGGIWVDATLYCNQPLNEWLQNSMGSGFFAFANPGPSRLLASWFIAAEPRNTLLAKWAARSILYWRDRTQTNEYFWLHHCFGELCSIDGEARAAWGHVPKISADGPHSVQVAGMNEPFEKVRARVDWLSPVFKLTYRLEPCSYKKGTLLSHILSMPGVSSHPFHTPRLSEKKGISRIAGLKVSTENLGDHIQIIAGQQLLARFNLAPELFIDRDDEIASGAVISAQKQSIGILLNGWFKTNPDEWPPAPGLVPVFLGFHIRLFQAPSLISSRALAYYKKHGPVGCRDRYTVSLLRSLGVDAFLSHCLTLSFPRRLPDIGDQTEIFVVSRDRRILDYLPTRLGPTTFISHYTGDNDFDCNMKQAINLLELYRTKARLIVTTLLHCALPAIAMGIPVVVIYPLNTGAQHQSDHERFSSIAEMIPVFHASELGSIDWNGYAVDVGDIKLAIIDNFAKIAKRWGRLPMDTIGPIAPANELPVPAGNDDADFSADPVRLNRIITCSAPDRQRWGDPNSYKPEWVERARVAASLVPNNATVMEIGVGTGALRTLLQSRCKYTGADLEPLDHATIALDLDNDPLPSVSYDFIIALGVYEYLYHPGEVVQKLASSSRNIILSYCCLRPQMDSVKPRRDRGWVNDYTEEAFVQLFRKSGFKVASRSVFNSAEDFEQIIFSFHRTA